MLSVNTESKREDCLYEPVSPTPLPDSPVEEAKPPPSAAGDKGSASPSQDEGFVEAKGRKKKSAATKRSELNRRGQEKERKVDLLDVFKDSAAPTEQDVDPEPSAPAAAAVAKHPTPEPLTKPEPVFKEPTPPPKVASAPPPPAVKQPSVEAESQPAAKADSDAVDKKPEPEVKEVKVNGIKSAEASNHVGENHKEEAEEGEILSDEEGEEEAKTKLKYEYKEDQWSPLNQEGKKQYDREFLIKMQYDILSMTKPSNLPPMEIVKDKPPQRQEVKSRGFDFAPHFVRSTTSRQGTVSKRLSKSKDAPKPVRVIQIPSFSQDVQLHKAEVAWTPGAIAKKKGVDVEQDEIDALGKKIRAILNKLTPQKFDTLVEQFKELPINTERKLKMAMELIFEKAVDEPSFSVAYAAMCKTMQLKKVPMEKNEAEEVNFRKLLISRVQTEFERDYLLDVDKDGYEAKMADPSLSEEEKKQAKMIYSASEMSARKRSLGNIRFIGELYKLQMLTVRIMHECVARLLKTTDDESLECLCRLVTTVGQEFEKETTQKMKTIPKEEHKNLRDINVYFAEMKKIISSKATSARVRFLMQDVVDLKNANWQKRREEAGPKTIEQIHADAKKEQLSEKLNMYSAPPPSSMSRGGRDDPRKRSTKGGGPGHTQGGEDGWQQLPTRAAKNTLDRIDTTKLRNIGSNKVDIDSLQLGPPGARGPGGFGGWSKGSSGSRSSRQEETPAMQHTNRFASLSSTESSQQSYEGRTSGGYGRHGARPPGSYAGRSSRGQSVENDKAAALQAVKDWNPSSGGRSTSTILSRDVEQSSAPSYATKSASMMAPIPSASTESLLKGRRDADREELKNKSASLLEEFLSVCDYNEAYQCIMEKFHSETIDAFVENTYNKVIESSEKNRRSAGTLLGNLVQRRLLPPAAYLAGLNAILEFAEDLMVDIPRFWDALAVILVPALQDEQLPLSFLKDSAGILRINTSMPGRYLAAVLRELARHNANRAAALWQASGLTLADFLVNDQDIEEFIRHDSSTFVTSYTPFLFILFRHYFLDAFQH